MPVVPSTSSNAADAPHRRDARRDAARGARPFGRRDVLRDDDGSRTRPRGRRAHPAIARRRPWSPGRSCPVSAPHRTGCACPRERTRRAAGGRAAARAGDSPISGDAATGWRRVQRAFAMRRNASAMTSAFSSQLSLVVRCARRRARRTRDRTRARADRRSVRAPRRCAPRSPAASPVRRSPHALAGNRARDEHDLALVTREHAPARHGLRRCRDRGGQPDVVGIRLVSASARASAAPADRAAVDRRSRHIDRAASHCPVRATAGRETPPVPVRPPAVAWRRSVGVAATRTAASSSASSAVSRASAAVARGATRVQRLRPQRRQLTEQARGRVAEMLRPVEAPGGAAQAIDRRGRDASAATDAGARPAASARLRDRRRRRGTASRSGPTARRQPSKTRRTSPRRIRCAAAGASAPRRRCRARLRLDRRAARRSAGSRPDTTRARARTRARRCGRDGRR